LRAITVADAATGPAFAKAKVASVAPEATTAGIYNERVCAAATAGKKDIATARRISRNLSELIFKRIGKNLGLGNAITWPGFYRIGKFMAFLQGSTE